MIGTAVIRGDERKLTPELFVHPLPPGFAVAAMNFHIAPNRLTTTTRIYASDARSLRSFKWYWTAIHPGSDVIRRMWLRAIKRRAERAER